MITIDNTLTGANPSVTVGAVGIFLTKSGATLDFRSLVAGANIALTSGSPTANDVTIAATGVVTTLANEGGGAQVWDSATAATLRTLLGTANGLTVTQNATTITIDNTLTGANVGAGTGTVFSAKSGATLQFNSLAGTANGLTVSAPAGNVITIDNTLTGANPSVTPGAVGVFNAKSGATLNFRSLVAGTGITLTSGSPTANDITVTNSSPGSAVTLSNAGTVGGNQTLVNAGTGPALATKGLNVGTGGLSIAATATDITLDNTLTGANVGAGAGTVFSAKSGATLQFNSLAGTSNGLRLGAGGQRDHDRQHTDRRQCRRWNGHGLQREERGDAAVQQPGRNVERPDSLSAGGQRDHDRQHIDRCEPVSNSGGGDLLTKSGATLNFRSLVAGTNITLTSGSPTANDVTIAATGGSGSVAHWYGTGVDGNVTIAANTTLTRDMYYANLTINTNITLTTGGYRIFVTGTLTFVSAGSTISGIGTSGTDGSAGGGGGTALPTNTVGGSTAGGNGGNAVAGSAGGASPASSQEGGAGGPGGSGDSGTHNGGAAGTTSPTAALNGGTVVFNDIIQAIRGRDLNGTKLIGGIGGGGGGGGATGVVGGGGGAGGGVVIVAANTITGTGTGWRERWKRRARQR